MMNTQTYEVRFTRRFTGGALKGAIMQQAAKVSSARAGRDLIRLIITRPDVPRPCAGSPYRDENPSLHAL